MRVGAVGCAMSHIKLYIELINSDYDMFIILEDDLDFTDNFDKKLLYLYNTNKDKSWEIIFLAYHQYIKSDDTYNKEKMPTIEKWGVVKSLTISPGGTGGYIITKSGAMKLLDFINKIGMTNCIDTMIQKSADIVNIYYPTPHLIYSDFYDGNNIVDTDIQFNGKSLSISLEERLKNEINFYKETINSINNLSEVIEICINKSYKEVIYYRDDNIDNINMLKDLSLHRYYCLDNKIIIIVPDDNVNRYFDRLKKNNNYDITDCLQYE
jgi:GR25 family glycosyltransferase involved in LPS biosynthesis